MSTIQDHGDAGREQRLEPPEDLDEEEFFRMDDGSRTLVGPEDLELTVPDDEKAHLEEEQRYWVNKPYSFVVIYHSQRKNEYRYTAVEPALSDVEQELVEFFEDKLRLSIDYETVSPDADPRERALVVRDQAVRLMKRYNLVTQKTVLGDDAGLGARLKDKFAYVVERLADRQVGGDDSASVDPTPMPRDPETGKVKTLNTRQIEKILYYLVRDFIRFNKLDPVKHDINVEDISCDGYESPVFAYHTDYGQLVTNIEFQQQELDEFVIRLAQNAGKGISKRQPSIDATLADGSRAQLTLGKEIADKGTNFTIRQFKDVPFTPVDLINWETFSLDQMAYIWLAIENGKSVMFAGGTASGKTTSLNAVSLFMPSTAKIVSIEDTRELEIPQKNWVPAMTRDSFNEGGAGEIDEFDLLEDALRQRPDYVVMGEVRGEEGRVLFQMMNTGHTTYTTFHADNPKEVIRRFTTDPINVSESMFGALDIISNQRSVDIDGNTVRRNTALVEVNGYNAKTDDFAINEVFRWDAETDDMLHKGQSEILKDVKEEKGWSQEELDDEIRRRKTVLAHLIQRNINSYAGVAATLQAYMSAPESVLGLVAENRLKNRIDELRQMKNVEIDVNPTKEALVPRPSPTDAVKQEVASLLAENDAVGEFAGDDVGFDEALPEEGPTADAEPNDTAVMADGDMSSDGGVTGEFDDDSLSDEVYGILAGDEMDVDDDGEESEQLDSVGGFGAGGDGTDDEPAEDSVASAMGLDDDGDDEGE